MSKEDMVKEAVEEAKAQAAEAEEAGADQKETAEKAENPAGDETSQTTDSTPEAQENAAEAGEAEESGNDADGSSEEQSSKTEKKKLFGKKNKKDKKDEKIDELTDRLTRQMAEFDNFRKRTEKEKSQMYEIGAKDIIEKILPIVDNFERGLASMPEDEKATPFAEGMEKIYKQLMTTLEGIGVKPIEAVGQEFNPDFHNAVMHVEDEELGENIIAEEFQKGYMYRDSVVRHSMVKVAN
ncbi:MAG TPA: nucleotide exchange factor GrpE [Candidatus Mediterraneibacter surreyensis]|nr:nucleotide exchange factor GrpE [Candidatus Mediterraneibacter surreyensis]